MSLARPVNATRSFSENPVLVRRMAWHVDRRWNDGSYWLWLAPPQTTAARVTLGHHGMFGNLDWIGIGAIPWSDATDRQEPSPCGTPSWWCDAHWIGNAPIDPTSDRPDGDDPAPPCLARHHGGEFEEGDDRDFERFEEELDDEGLDELEETVDDMDIEEEMDSLEDYEDENELFDDEEVDEPAPGANFGRFDDDFDDDDELDDSED